MQNLSNIKASFIVVYKSLLDFNDFIYFKHFKKFQYDLYNSSKDDSYIQLKYYLYHSVYSIYSSCINFTNTNDDIYSLFDLANIYYSEYDKITKPIFKLNDVFVNNITKKFPDITLYNDNFNAEQINFINNQILWFTNEFNKIKDNILNQTNNLSNIIINNLTQDDYHINALYYNNDDIMKCKFIPFVAINPERNYEIFTIE